MSAEPFQSRFIDGTVPSDRYLQAVSRLIDWACKAEEEHGVEECERAAERNRAGEAYIDHYGKGYQVCFGNWSIFSDVSDQALARCLAVRDLPKATLERLMRARRRLSHTAGSYSRKHERLVGDRWERFQRLRGKLNDWALAAARAAARDLMRDLSE
jgi:hypothetical protein